MTRLVMGKNVSVSASTLCMLNLEAVIQRYSVKKLFLKVSQNSQENTCARVSFLTLLKKDSGTGLFL